MNSGKTTQEPLDIADALFTSIMRGNKIGIEAMFTSKDLVKPKIRSEAIGRMKLCSAQTMSAVTAMLKELCTRNEDPPAELVRLATQYFPYFWMRSFEDIRQGR
tara:strand:- start:194 stop:505 length:312 start_codon:yes stop_codon:yes gene_type:complete